MKKLLFPIIITIIVIVIVVIFFYFTHDEAVEINSNLNSNPDQVAHTCQEDDDCTGTCTCGCQHVLGTCPTDSDACHHIIPPCQCQNGACQEKLEALNSNLNQNINSNTNQTAVEAETVTATEFTQTGNVTGNSESGFTLVYENVGAPALSVELNFSASSSCTIDGIPMTCSGAMDQDLIYTGDLVTVTGTEEIPGEVTVTMLDK